MSPSDSERVKTKTHYNQCTISTKLCSTTRENVLWILIRESTHIIQSKTHTAFLLVSKAHIDNNGGFGFQDTRRGRRNATYPKNMFAPFKHNARNHWNAHSYLSQRIESGFTTDLAVLVCKTMELVWALRTVQFSHGTGCRVEWLHEKETAIWKYSSNNYSQHDKMWGDYHEMVNTEMNVPWTYHCDCRPGSGPFGHIRGETILDVGRSNWTHWCGEGGPTRAFQCRYPTLCSFPCPYRRDSQTRSGNVQVAGHSVGSSSRFRSCAGQWPLSPV